MSRALSVDDRTSETRLPPCGRPIECAKRRLPTLIGYLVARYHYYVQDRLEEQYRISIRDELTRRRRQRDRALPGLEHETSGRALG